MVVGGTLPRFHPNFTSSVRQKASQAWKNTWFIPGAVLVFQTRRQQQRRDAVNGLAAAPNARHTWSQHPWPTVGMLPAPTGARGQGQDQLLLRELLQEQRFRPCLTGAEPVSAAPAGSWGHAGRRLPLLSCFSSPTRLALGIEGSKAQGRASVQGQNTLLKYFLSTKMTSFRLLPARSRTKAKNKFPMCSVFLFTT